MPRPDVSHERIPQILDAAAELFSRRGIDGAGMNELSEATGLSKAAIYHYFPGKDSIIHSLVERLFATDQPHLEALAHDSERSAVERLLEYVDRLSEFLGKTSGLQPVFLESYSRASRDPVIAEMIAKFFKGYHQLCEKIIRQGIATGELDDSLKVKAATSALVTQVEGCLVIANLTNQRVEKLLRQNLRFIIERL
ncbi:MAG: TetR/AcrR family transcriptional regulator [Verrucomicrobiota bacterium]